MKRVVGISDMAVSEDPQDVLITYSLGSCLGLTAYDPQKQIGGLIHCMLPLSSMDPTKAKANPCMFTDTGVTQLLTDLLKRGAVKDRLVIKVAGCAAPLDAGGRFKIGERNYTVLRKILWKNGILLKAEDIGGVKPRTLSLQVDSGRTTIKSGSEENEF